MNWQLRWQHWPDYRLLMRLDKPIGIYLLLWPTWWALWLAAEGVPDPKLLVIFTLGVILMRSAGCVINDYADRHVDGLVERTAQRPLAQGRVSASEALQLFTLLIALSASLLFWLNWQTVLLSLIAVLLAAVYPYMKRYTYLPQVVLGAAFSWGMPMAFMAIQLQLPAVVWFLYLANLLWTVAYDTFYAMVDQPDDLHAGIKSTAILFGAQALPIIGLLQLLTLILLGYVGLLAQLTAVYFAALFCCALLFIYQLMIAASSRQGCFKAFLHNHYVGLLVFSGIALHYVIY
ncbi:4-hydroxybenzoate polyprenyltransferase [Arsukibacterium ikkense]|uniref:4-hydroxybenzoate octaprenyltransferase n=1 Tax=Arsukibacterium ikkense TaxID=336831 RepID=A0A0M2V656_9GAMM|nr:4-hydroxybenzoate octaprenyltransferase [Arsukibacterium ikkense]KKO46332.1 4-hydroxybenzoate polyprenyltransferase [Arsukibacterium ikkense]